MPCDWRAQREGACRAPGRREDASPACPEQEGRGRAPGTREEGPQDLYAQAHRRNREDSVRAEEGEEVGSLSVTLEREAR